MVEAQRVGHKLECTLPQEKLPVVEDMLMGEGAAIDVSKKGESWVLSAFFDAALAPLDAVNAAWAMAARAVDVDVDVARVMPVYAEDMAAKMRQEFPPLDVGSFFIHTFDEPVPAGKIELHVPANQAFGTGEHPTTASCLRVYEEVLAQHEGVFTSGLDMGCGSAILAMAAAKMNGTPFLAVDIDGPSVKAACDNISANALAAQVRCVEGNGFSSDDVREGAPFDLIFANILANPLIEMAPALSAVLAPGGVAILSGYHDEGQRAQVEAAYGACALTLIGAKVEKGWVAQAFKKEEKR